MEWCGVAPTTVFPCLSRDIIKCFLPSFPKVSNNSENVEDWLHLPQTVNALGKKLIFILDCLLDNIFSDHKIRAWSSKVSV